MTTLKKFLDTKIKYFHAAGNEYKESHHMYWFYHGNARALQDMLDSLPKELLTNKLPESIWRV